ncbi:MAG: HEAT repeat domain-containing protein [Gammaproteobacteria bacterium]|nr:HEAT repeat domain-containing protein [Gammaproteobacteria bacterium]
MTTPDNSDQLQQLLMQYLYGEMNEAERLDFDRQLAASSALRAMLAAEQRFDSAIPVGTQPLIDANRLQGSSWLLHQNLQREMRTAFSLRRWLQELIARPLVLASQCAALTATFVLGVLIALPQGEQLDRTDLLADNSANPGLAPLAFINSDDYEIYQLQVNSYDAASGAIDLTFSLAAETRLTGNVADQGIHQLMAVALQNDIDPAARIDTINALQPVRNGSDVFEALIYVLRNDENPGVRYQAVQSLVALAHEEQVREALRFALSEDVNPGVRLEAFQALANNPDSKTLAVFREQMDQDSNEYIRAQARNIVEGIDDATFEL